MVMDFGGNDCDFHWKEIAEDPTGDHQPNVPLPEFVELYREMIRRVRSHGIRPILTNLPPLDSERFFNWWCGDLDKEAVMRWLGDVGNIYVWQERYSRAVERLAREEMCRWWMSEEPFWTTAIWSRPLRRWYPPQHRWSGLDHKGVSGFWPWTAAGRSDRLTNEQKYGPVLKTGRIFYSFLKMWMRKDA